MTNNDVKLNTEPMKPLPCRKCGSGDIDHWDGKGTQAEMNCNECGSGESVQVSDLLTYKERYFNRTCEIYLGGTSDFNYKTLTYPEWVVQRAKNELIKKWNTRHDSSPALLTQARDALELLEPCDNLNMDEWKRREHLKQTAITAINNALGK